MPIALEPDEIGAKIIDGKQHARLIRREIRRQVRKLKFTPGLAVVQVGNDPASTSLRQQQGEGLSVCPLSFRGASHAGRNTASSGHRADSRAEQS